MAKEINEKTFELNITSELINISKAYIYYMLELPIHHFMSENEWFDLFLNNTLFAEGLTQSQETNPKTGGYDVSINYNSGNGTTGRLLFLQFKAGEHADFCMNGESQFHGNRYNKKPHIIFKFNDAANNTQHSTLRKLANKPEIKSDSVLYVFPRITQKSEFLDNTGNLLSKTSFVPVLEIDKQASEQNPKIEINNEAHKYRTSYDGLTSEVNYYYYVFNYNPKVISELISELACVHLERFFKKIKLNGLNNIRFNKFLKERLNDNLEYFKGIFINKEIINSYLNQFIEDDFKSNIPKAPQKYTTEIPYEGIRFSINLDNKEEFDSDFILNNISYQII